jgi:hypothetical protein
LSGLLSEGGPVGVASTGWSLAQTPATGNPQSSMHIAADAVRPPHEILSQESFTSADTKWYGERPCLAVSTVTCRSSAGVNVGQRTIDRDLTTHWAPSGPGPQWITYDLGRMHETASVTLVWYATKAVSVPFTVEVSSDGVTYERQGSGSLADRDTVSTLCTLLPTDGRYVRLSFSPAEGIK